MPLHEEMRSSRLLDEMCEVLSFNAAISTCERGGQWQCVALPLDGRHGVAPWLGRVGFGPDTSTLDLDG
eukprot:873595-Karenia_brevis.AAC.1